MIFAILYIEETSYPEDIMDYGGYIWKPKKYKLEYNVKKRL